MPDKINTDLQRRFLGTCDAFRASAKPDESDSETIARTFFIKKLLAFIESIDSSNGNYGYTINYIYERIVDYDILLPDMLSYFSDKAITATTFKRFLNEYSADATTKKAGLLKRIMTEALETGSSETSVGDIIEADSLFAFNMPMPDGLYVKPNIKYSFDAASSYFRSSFDACQDFSLKVKTFVSSNAAYAALSLSSYPELEALRQDAFGSSSDGKLTLMWRVGNARDYALLSWLKRMDFESIGTDDLEKICKARLTALEYEDAFGTFVYRIYQGYASIISEYDTRNSEFDLKASMIKAISNAESEAISHGNFMGMAFFWLACSKNAGYMSAKSAAIDALAAKLKGYANAAKSLEGVIDSFRSQCASDSKYELR